MEQKGGFWMRFPPTSPLVPSPSLYPPPPCAPSETKLISQIDEDRPGGEKPRCVSYISNSRGSSQIGRRLKGKIVGVHWKISGLSLSPSPARLALGTKMMSSFSVAGQPPRISPPQRDGQQDAAQGVSDLVNK